MSFWQRLFRRKSHAISITEQQRQSLFADVKKEESRLAQKAASNALDTVRLRPSEDPLLAGARAMVGASLRNRDKHRAMAIRLVAAKHGMKAHTLRSIVEASCPNTRPEAAHPEEPLELGLAALSRPDAFATEHDDRTLDRHPALNRILTIGQEPQVSPQDKKSAARRILVEIDKLESSLADLDLVCLWKVHALTSLDRDDEAFTSLEEGFRICKRKDRLAEFVAATYVEDADPRAIGWIMQTCILRSPKPLAYLWMSYAAEGAGCPEIAARCLNACDILEPRMWRQDNLATAIPNLARQLAVPDVQDAMRSFESAMNERLPQADELPVTEIERARFLAQQPEKLHIARERLAVLPN